MKRDIYIQTIRNYILEKHGHSPSEIQNFAHNLHATMAELKQAQTEAQEIKENRKHKNSSLVTHHSPVLSSPNGSIINRQSSIVNRFSLPHIHAVPALAIQSVAIVSLIGIVVLGGLSMYLFTKVNRISQQLNAVSVGKPKTPAELSLLAAPVYANQQPPVDVNEIFSYPATDITLTYSGVPNKTIFGFFPYWMLEKQDKINITGYTDIALFGLTADNKGNIITSINDKPEPGWTMWNDPKLDTFIRRAKSRKSNINLVIKSFKNEDIEGIVNSNDNQERLIANAVQLMNSKSLDGINIDFEYIGAPDEKTRNNFTRFIANLNQEMKRQNPESQLTIDTYVSSAADDKFFDIQGLSNHVDAFIIMGYDIHTPSGEAGPVSPLEGDGSLSGYLQSYLSRTSPNKIILALPYYGYDWPVNPNPTIDKKAQSKILPYAVIAANNKNETIEWNKTTQTPYYQYRDDQGNARVVHFDNARSMGLKYDMIKTQNLKGTGTWALGYDGLNQELHKVLLDKFTE